MNTLKRQLKDRETTIGSWLSIPHETSAEIMARAGFEWLVLDMEHAPIGREAAARLIRIIDLAGIPAICRLPANDPVIAKSVLDAGASGIIVPAVESAEEARQAVAAVYYPPKGQRGVGLFRAQGYGSGFEAYRKRMQDALVVIVMIETRKGLEQVDAIAAVPGIDGVLIGPYDLSASLGVIGQLDHPDLHAALQNVIVAAQQADIGCGLHVVHPEPEAINAALHAGYTFLAVGADMIFLDQAARAAVKMATNG